MVARYWESSRNATCHVGNLRHTPKPGDHVAWNSPQMAAKQHPTLQAVKPVIGLACRDRFLRKTLGYAIGINPR